MLLPHQDEVLLHIIRCPRCGKVFRTQTGPWRTRCAAMHAPGDCCHYGDAELSMPTVTHVLTIVGDKPSEVT